MIKGTGLALLPESLPALLDSVGPVQESHFQGDFGHLSIPPD